MSVILTYLVRKGVPLIFVLFILFVIVGTIYGLQILLTGSSLGSVDSNFWLLLVGASALSAIGNLAVIRANALSPNPGLVTTIVGLQAGITAILAVKFLNNRLNSVQIVGLVLGVLAVIVIALGSRQNMDSTKNKDAMTKFPNSELGSR